jgi:hypothetical protein
MLQLGQITALGTVVFTAVLLLKNIVAMARLQFGGRYKAEAKRTNARLTKVQAASSSLTQLIVWGAGVLAVYMADWAGLSNAFTIGGLHLAAMGVGAKIVLGLMASSTLSVVNQIKMALDNTDSARTSPLLGNPILPPIPPTTSVPQ